MDTQEPRSTNRHQQTSVRTAKVGHKKTRTGCLTCRFRKVKCDEVSPECYHRPRLRLHCGYPNRTEPAQSHTPIQLPSPPTAAHQRLEALADSYAQQSHHAPCKFVVSDTMPVHDRMALRLLHSWMSRGLRAYNMAALSEWRKIWLIEIPELALKHEYLLYALLALSATQLSGTIPTEPELEVARFKYWSMALSKQQNMISRNCSADVEPVTFAALLIAINAFAMLRDRDIEPYVPPVDWLEVSKGFWDVCPKREKMPVGTSLRIITDVTLPMWKSGNGPIHPAYQPLLGKFDAEDTFGDMEVYEETLALISSFREAVQKGEPSYYNVRRICTLTKRVRRIMADIPPGIFAQIVPRGFINFLQERRGRALVTLAAFFVVVAHSDALSYFGDVNGVIPQREVKQIAQIVLVLPFPLLSFLFFSLFSGYIANNSTNRY